MLCPKCGNPIAEGEYFCVNCGEKQDVQPVPQINNPPQPGYYPTPQQISFLTNNKSNESNIGKIAKIVIALGIALFIIGILIFVIVALTTKAHEILTYALGWIVAGTVSFSTGTTLFLNGILFLAFTELLGNTRKTNELLGGQNNKSFYL